MLDRETKRAGDARPVVDEDIARRLISVRGILLHRVLYCQAEAHTCGFGSSLAHLTLT